MLAAFIFAAAAAPSIGGCGSVAITKAESTNAPALTAHADCFAKAKALADAAEKARRARIAAIAPPPASTVAGEVPAVASGLDVAALLRPKGIPPTMAPDVVGAFRFVCSAGQLLNDDPLVWPGQPGKAHLHQFFGNLDADAFSTYTSLRAHGSSTCTSDLNRSAYWAPALLDGRGNAVRPDDLNLYYKRRPASDPVCTTAAKACADIPRGFRLIFGWNQFAPNDPQPENVARFNYMCVANGHPVSAATSNMSEALAACKPGQQFHVGIQTPLCWNGALDSPDHRSHMADMRRDASTGYVPKCPDTHPYILPQLTLGLAYTIGAGDDPTQWYFSSDHMKPGGKPGETFHADYDEAWQDDIRQAWHAGCINGLLNCSDGDLGDGRIMARNRYYPTGFASPRLVAIPAAK